MSMERLTKRIGENVYFTQGKYESTLPAECETQDVRNILHRLAAYEDTGLKPETVSKIRDIVLDISGNLDRLRELAQADRDGRCWVLPCKKGDTVYRIVNDVTPHITKDRCTDIKIKDGYVWVYLIGNRVMGKWNFGELLFLTREEAEAALKERDPHD